jgi:hypothetical protein
MRDPTKPRLPGDYSHILPPEKPTAAKLLGLQEVTESRFPPALTKEQLEEMKQRRKGDDDVKALLWEVARLRTHVLRFDQLLRSMYGLTVHESMLKSLASEIKDEPCITELRKAWEPKKGEEE